MVHEMCTYQNKHAIHCSFGRMQWYTPAQMTCFTCQLKLAHIGSTYHAKLYSNITSSRIIVHMPYYSTRYRVPNASHYINNNCVRCRVVTDTFFYRDSVLTSDNRTESNITATTDFSVALICVITIYTPETMRNACQRFIKPE